MDEQQNIQPMQSDFERVRKETADGKEYWSARELRCSTKRCRLPKAEE